MLNRFSTAAAVAVVSLLGCTPASAQTSAGDPAPQPSPVQSTVDSTSDPGPDVSGQATDQPPRVVRKVRNYLEKSPIIQKLKGDGFYPRIGGLSPGSGLAGGAGYRRHLDWAFVDVSAAASTKAYRGVDATIGWMKNKHVDLASKLTFRNDTQDDFYGLGIDTTDATRVDYGIRSTDLSTRFAVYLMSRLRLGADVGYYIPAVRHGRDANVSTIESLFTDISAPGLARQPRFVHDSVFAELDSRDARGFPRRGGFYRAAYTL